MTRADTFSIRRGRTRNPVAWLPARAQTRPTATAPWGGPTNVGRYTSTESTYGTSDQAGNLDEWNETIIAGGRAVRGGSFEDSQSALLVGPPDALLATEEAADLGFRIAQSCALPEFLPEPGSLGSFLAGALLLSGLERRRQRQGRAGVRASLR